MQGGEVADHEGQPLELILVDLDHHQRRSRAAVVNSVGGGGPGPGHRDEVSFIDGVS
ncbi:MAG: hypothetical protein M3063_10660 [Actinomycetota bacterium]|nr:hypothetical protein [Actinomycetota bacterium]